MRKKHKTAFKVLALVLGLFAVTGCTANFCSVNDKAHILYNYDAGLSYDEAGQPIIKDDVLQFKNEAVTKQMASIAKNYDVPSKTFFVALMHISLFTVAFYVLKDQAVMRWALMIVYFFAMLFKERNRIVEFFPQLKRKR